MKLTNLTEKLENMHTILNEATMGEIESQMNYLDVKTTVGNILSMIYHITVSLFAHLEKLRHAKTKFALQEAKNISYAKIQKIFWQHMQAMFLVCPSCKV